jgi:CHAT domain-containing protein
VQINPRKARGLAERALAAAAAANDTGEQIAAANALGWAQSVLGEAAAARETWREGIRLAERHGDRRGAGLLHRQLAVWHAWAGESRAAWREMETAVALLSGRDRAQSQVHRLAILKRARQADPDVHRRVCADAARALYVLRCEGDAIWVARLLYNRGLLFLDRGEIRRADRDLRGAYELYASAGAEAAATNTLVVRAELALLQGDVLSALKTLEHVHAGRADRRNGHDYNVENVYECRVLTLAQARLLPEAGVAANEYIDLCKRTGRSDHLAEATLDLAAIALMAGDAAAAARFATSAMRSFASRGKHIEAARARGALLRAQLLDGSVRASSVRSALLAAEVLEAAGWRRDALRTRLLAARLALAVGKSRAGLQQLVLARPLNGSGTVTDRIELCYVEAILRVADGQAAKAQRFLRHGLQLLDDYRAALGAVELRATATGIGGDLASLGLRLALDSNRPERVLSWGERLRAAGLRLPAVRPTADTKLRQLQAELRRAMAERAGGRQAALESAIRSRSRLVEPKGGTEAAIPDALTAARALGNRALIEYIEIDGVRYALVLADRQITLHDIDATTTGAGELDWLRFAYGRLAGGRLNREQRAVTLANATASAAALEELLIAPLREALGEAPLVIVPTGALHALPWAALPSLRGRPFAVAPSLALWCDLAARPRSRRRKTALVAGPRLRHSAAEVKELGALRPGSTVLYGKAATAKSTLAALDGAAIAHLACHGHFRADSPLFSSLELADGPLNVYELQRLRRAPEIVVLSACDLGLSQTHPGDELLGLAAALLGMGTRTVVASVVPVPDAAARRVMLAFHQHLLAGDAPAAALARAQARARTAGFACLGTG